LPAPAGLTTLGENLKWFFIAQMLFLLLAKKYRLVMNILQE
jgi:hypothetical protein